MIMPIEFSREYLSDLHAKITALIFARGKHSINYSDYSYKLPETNLTAFTRNKNDRVYLVSDNETDVLMISPNGSAYCAEYEEDSDVPIKDCEWSN